MRTRGTVQWRFLQAIARILTSLLFDLKVYGRHNLPARGGVLIVSNHQGNLDPVLLGARLRRPLNYIAKSELFANRFASYLLRVLNAFPVRQGAGDVGAIKETIQRLREGHLLNIFPEGARTSDGQLQPLQKGVALIIRRSRVPVVPAVIVGSFEAWPMHRRLFRPWPIFVEFGPPMNLAGMTSRQIVSTLDQTLRTMLASLRARAQSSTHRHSSPGQKPSPQQPPAGPST